MAGKRIQGITIEIGGDTTKLSASLKNVDSSISATKRALSDVEKLLKLDPSNTELLAQKQKLLGDAVEQTKERLAKLKEASEAAAKTKGNYDAWKAAITPLWQEIDKTSNHLKALKARQQEMKDAGEVDTDAYKALQKEIDDTSAHLKDLKEQARQVTQEFGHPISPEKYDALQREIIETEHDLAGLESKSKDTGEAEKKLAAQSQEAGKGLEVLGNAAKAVGAALAAAFAASTAAVVAFSKSSVDVGSAFDRSMSQVAATMGKTVAEVTNLRDFAQEMGAKTAFSATQAADALNYMSLAGYDAETSMSVLPNVLNLAAAGSMELAAASDMITDSLSALGRDSDYATTLVDQMAAASSKANASVEQMGSAILTVGGTAKALSGGTTELNTALGLLADNGIKGAEGGTALRNVILSLTAPTDKAAAQLKELGVKALDSAGDMRSMKDIFTDLDKALSGMSDGKKTEVLNNIFNKTDLKSVNALLATNVERWDELSAAIENSKYAAERMADTQLDNLAGDVTLFQSALEGAQIVVSDALMPKLREFVQFGTEGITRVTDAFKNADVAKSLAEGFRDAEGVMKPIEENADAIREKFSAFRELAPLFSFRDEAGELKELSERADSFYQTLSRLSADTQADIAKALGLDDVDALYEVLDENSGLTWKVEKLFATADAAMEKDRDLAKALLNTDDMAEVNAMLDETGAHYDELLAHIETLDPSQMTDGFSAAMRELPALVENGVGMLMDALPQFLETGARVLGALVTGISSNLPAIGDAASGALSFLVDGVMTGLPALTDSAVSAMQSFGQSIRDNLPALMQSGLEIAVGLSASIRDNAGKLVDGAVSLALSLARGLADSIPVIVENVPAIVTNIAGVINDNAPKILTAAVGIAVTLGKGLLQALPTIVANIPKIIQAIVAVFTAFNWLNLGKNIITAIKNGVSVMKTAIPETMKSIGESAKSLFKSIDWHNLGTSVLNLVKNGIASLKDAIPQAMRNIATAAVNKFKSVDWAKVGRDIINGLISGIRGMAKNAVEAVGNVARNMLQLAKNTLGIASPSKEFSWIGRMIDEGFAKGISDNADKAESEAQKLAKSVYSTVSVEAERQIKYEALSLSEQLEMWREIQRKFAEGSDEWWDARDRVFDLEAKAASEQAQNIRDTYNGLIQSVEYATKRYGWSTRTQLSHYEEIRGQFERNSEEWLAADEKVFDTRQKLLSEQESAWKNYASNLKGVVDTVNGLESDYQKELSKRAGEIANSYKLFAKVPAAEEISGADLLDNLREQVRSIGAFYDNLEKLSERGAGAALVDEIRAMGVGASDELEALLSLSDRKLARYAELYEEKQELANSIAVRELSELRTETDNKIRENLDSIESLYDEYAPVIGRSLPEGLAEGIRDGMREALDAADALANALQTRFDRMGGGVGLQSLMDAAAENARVLTMEPAAQSRTRSAAVREEAYGYDNRARSAPITFTVNNNVGGRRVAQLQRRYEDDETARRGPRLVQTGR